jgi:single-stranded DNA-specific DHH superfamily exonuclease
MKELAKGRIVVVHHSDADGICSAALIAIALKRLGNFPLAIVSPKFTEIDEGFVRRIKRLGPDFLVVLDIPISLLSPLLDFNPLIIDHHPGKISAKRLLYSSERCTSYLTFKFCSTLARLEDAIWIATLGCLGDKDKEGYKELLKPTLQTYPELDEKTLARMMRFISSAKLYGELGISSGVNALIESVELGIPTSVLGSTPNAIRLMRLKQISERQRDYWLSKHREKAMIDEKKSLLVFQINSIYPIQNYIAGTLANAYPKLACFVINLGLDPRFALVEARTRGKTNVGMLLNSICKELEHASGGGHKQAGGGKFLKRDLERFLLLLRKIT